MLMVAAYWRTDLTMRDVGDAAGALAQLRRVELTAPGEARRPGPR
ncbi:hypothetical protein [Streptomyces sp. NPDC051572]